MFKKGNWKGFLNVIHYLLTIIEPSKVQFSTILLDPKAKLNFRSTISKILKELRTVKHLFHLNIFFSLNNFIQNLVLHIYHNKYTNT